MLQNAGQSVCSNGLPSVCLPVGDTVYWAIAVILRRKDYKLLGLEEFDHIKKPGAGPAILVINIKLGGPGSKSPPRLRRIWTFDTACFGYFCSFEGLKACIYGGFIF